MLIKQENKRSVEIACQHAFNYLNSQVEEWDSTDGEPYDQYYKQQLISMVFYNTVFKFGSNITGYCENGAEKELDDHFLSPRMGCYSLMNQKRELLDNYEEFRKFFYLLRYTIKIIKTKNDSDEIKFVNSEEDGIVVKNLTIDKYDLIVDNWVYVKGKGRKRSIQDLDPKLGFPLKHLVPDFFTAEEKKYYTPRGNLKEYL